MPNCQTLPSLVERLRNSKRPEEDDHRGEESVGRPRRLPHLGDRDEDEGGGGEEVERLMLLLDQRRRPKAGDRQDLEGDGGAGEPVAACNDLQHRRVCEGDGGNLKEKMGPFDLILDIRGRERSSWIGSQISRILTAL